jgi:hypothetical protein
MSLCIRYLNGKYGFVSESVLTALIENKEITKFKRSGGWVDINSEPVRKADGPSSYMGRERRLH